MMKRCVSAAKRVMGILPTIVAALLICSALCAIGYAGEEWEGVPSSPEIDPRSMGSALALLAGAGMLVADKLRRKAK